MSDNHIILSIFSDTFELHNVFMVAHPLLKTTTPIINQLKSKIIPMIAPTFPQLLQPLSKIPHTTCLEFAASTTIPKLIPTIQFLIPHAVFKLLLIFLSYGVTLSIKINISNQQQDNSIYQHNNIIYINRQMTTTNHY